MPTPRCFSTRRLLASWCGLTLSFLAAASGRAQNVASSAASSGNTTAPAPAPRTRHPPPMPANPNLPTLWLIGDSTVHNGNGDGSNGQWGWGEEIGAYFDAAKLNVVNRAHGGTSSRTYYVNGDWAGVLKNLRPGDFVIMQFGHNDGGALNDNSRARGSIKGVGDESQAIDNQLTGKHEVVHSYGWYLRQFIAETRAHGATPIVCSQIPRKIWHDGQIARNKGDYAGWAQQVAQAENAPFVDLNEIIARQYDALGAAAVAPLFGPDPAEHTHTTRAGAKLNAESVVAGLKALPQDPLAPYFSSAGAAVAAADLSAPEPAPAKAAAAP